jgi:hypothetical protein
MANVLLRCRTNPDRKDGIQFYSLYAFSEGQLRSRVCWCAFDKPGFYRLSLANQWQLPLRFNALSAPPVTSVKANASSLAAQQKNPNDVQNLPNANALSLTRVASGSAESTASDKTTFE